MVAGWVEVVGWVEAGVVAKVAGMEMVEVEVEVLGVGQVGAGKGRRACLEGQAGSSREVGRGGHLGEGGLPGASHAPLLLLATPPHRPAPLHPLLAGIHYHRTRQVHEAPCLPAKPGHG
jgi:hypothetical protein